MKTLKRISLVALFALVPFILMAQDKNKSVQTVKFATSITCSNCVNTIMTNLPQEKGIKDVKCDLKTKEVTVVYQKEKNNPEEIKKSLEKLGFTAKPVKEEAAKEKK